MSGCRDGRLCDLLLVTEWSLEVNIGGLLAAPSKIVGGAALAVTLWMLTTATRGMEVSLSESVGERAGTTEVARVVDAIALSIG